MAAHAAVAALPAARAERARCGPRAAAAKGSAAAAVPHAGLRHGPAAGRWQGRPGLRRVPECRHQRVALMVVVRVLRCGGGARAVLWWWCACCAVPRAVLWGYLLQPPQAPLAPPAQGHSAAG